MKTCRIEGCKRAPAFPDQAYCADHRIHWTARRPDDPTESPFMRRVRERRVPPKDMTGAAA